MKSEDACHYIMDSAANREGVMPLRESQTLLSFASLIAHVVAAMLQQNNED